MIRNDPTRTDGASGLRERLPGPDVTRRLNISRTSLWRWRQQPGFPAPVAVGKLRLFDVVALEEWLSTRQAR
jgi:predicted DNA-binding transcriptional regulator AlpA